jgi:NAD(P)-dependent dehydrogenase (short-subunit alcohol dehydrogenase family)
MKIAMVTGGLRGIGLGITKALLRDGFAVSAMGTSPPEKVQAILSELSGAVRYSQGSVDRAEDRERFLAETLAAYGRVDALVNNAGVAPLVRMPLLDMTEESYDRVMGINLKGTLFLSQIAARELRKQAQGGVIINVSSLSAYTASVARGEYCISKIGMSMLTQLFAAELAADGIGVYEIRPGIIETDMTAVVHQKYTDAIEGGLLPIARWGKPEDIGEAVSLLCSGRLRYSTGDVLNVDGGFHLRRL